MMTSTPHVTRKATLLVALLLALSATARAQLLAYESFNYSPGASFATGGSTATTATGFSGNLVWDFGTTTASIIQSGSLGYTDAGPVALTTSNNFYENGHGRLAATFDVSGGGPFASYLESGRIGANGTTIYLSFLYRNTTASSAGYSGFELFRGSNVDANRILSTNTWTGQANSNFHLTVGEGANGGTWGGGVTSGINADLGFINSSVNFFVIKIDFGSGTDTATFYANPLLSSPGSAAGTVSAADLSFDRIANSVFSGAPPLYIDEIRIGTTYAAVTAIPEPGTAAILSGFAALGLIALRRRLAACG